MTSFPTSILVIVALSVAVCILAMLHVLSCIIKHEVTLHNLRNRVEGLNNDYTVHLARMSGEIPQEVEVQIIDPETDGPEAALETAQIAEESAADAPALEPQAA